MATAGGWLRLSEQDLLLHVAKRVLIRGAYIPENQASCIGVDEVDDEASRHTTQECRRTRLPGAFRIEKHQGARFWGRSNQNRVALAHNRLRTLCAPLLSARKAFSQMSC